MNIRGACGFMFKCVSLIRVCVWKNLSCLACTLEICLGIIGFKVSGGVFDFIGCM